MDHKKTREQLGMPFGTASGRLLKQLLLHLAKQLNLDSCFQCGKRIEVANQFSIEHKRPWLDVSPDLFWDLDNVAFSHKSCNIAAARKNNPRLREQLDRIRVDHMTKAPEGKAWCYGHKDFLDKSLFNRNKWFPSGVQRFCRQCRSGGIGR